MAVNLPERIQSKIMPEPNSGCWLWTASLDGKGYGQIMCGRNNLKRAHRLVYESLRGAIPAGLDLDHKCRVRSCVNPDHLEPVTRAENLRRGIGNRAALQAKTHCKNGHEYSVKNTRWYCPPGRENFPQRICRICAANAVRKFRERNP